jgi:cellulose synthase operon protein C
MSIPTCSSWTNLGKHGKRSLILFLMVAGVTSMAYSTPEKASKYYEDALQRYEKGDLPGAAIQLKNSIQQDQNMLAAHLLLGKVLLKSGEIKGAEAAFEAALAQGVNRSELAVQLGQIYLMMGEPQKVLDNITVAGMPKSLQAEILTLRGAAYGMSGSTTQATKSFADARAADPHSAAPLIAEAPMLLKMKDMDRAKATAAKAIELAPDNAAAWYTQGVVLQGLQDFKGAMAAQDRALAINPTYVDAHVAHASLLITLGRAKEAGQELDQLANSELLDPRASYLRGLLATRAGDTSAAKQAYGDVVGMIDSLPLSMLSSNENLLLTGALAHQALGNREKAQGYLESLLSLNRKNTAAQVLLASMLMDAKDNAKALPLLEAAQRTNPDDPQVLYLLGTLRLERKQYLQASQLFEKAAAHSNEPSVLRELGASQLALGEGQAGLANLAKVVASNPADLKAAVQLALAYAAQGKIDKALQTAEAIVKRDPSNLTMLNFLGNVKGRSGDKRGARAAFEQVLAKSPSFQPAAINLSWLDIEEHQFDSARNRLTKMLAQSKDDPGLLFQLGVLELRARHPADAMRYWARANDLQRSDPRPGFAMVDLLSSQGQVDKALEAAKSLALNYPDNLPVQLALGRTYLATGDNSSARSTFKNATRLADYDVAKQVQIGRLQLMAGAVDDAAYNVLKALQANPDNQDALVLQVEVEFRRGDAAKVDAALKTLSAKYPGSVNALMTTAHVAMARGQFPAALSGYRSVMDKEPSTGNAILVTRAYIAAGQPDQALAFMEAWSKKRPTDQIALKALTQVQIQTGKFEDARKNFKQILVADPEDSSTLSDYAQVLQQLGDPAAVAVAEKAQKLSPENPEYADVLGWILVQRGNTEDGLRHLREARLRQPSNGEIRFHLAYALAKTGRKVEAKDEMAAALAAPVKVRKRPEVTQLMTTLGL